MRLLPRLALLVFCVALTACGGDTAGGDVQTAGSAVEVAVAEVDDGVVTLAPEGETMRYARTAFTATAGTPLTIRFTNTATGAAMRHNVVVLRPGTDVDAFGVAAASAMQTDYIPPSMQAQVVAHTPMSDPGETVEVAFTVPTEPGLYPFVCTFPGHYATMRGVMTVVPA